MIWEITDGTGYTSQFDTNEICFRTVWRALGLNKKEKAAATKLIGLYEKQDAQVQKELALLRLKYSKQKGGIKLEYPSSYTPHEEVSAAERTRRHIYFAIEKAERRAEQRIESGRYYLTWSTLEQTASIAEVVEKLINAEILSIHPKWTGKGGFFSPQSCYRLNGVMLYELAAWG